MTTYNTGNQVPSDSLKDAVDNAETYDGIVNSYEQEIATRTGKKVKTLAGYGTEIRSRVDNALANYATPTSRGDWTTATAYNEGDLWRNIDTWYLVTSDYISGASVTADIANAEVVEYTNVNRMQIAFTIAELANASVLFEGQSIYLSSGGRSGLFRLSLIDHSTDVKSDGLQGFFVALSSDTSGASGAWVRENNCDVVNAQWWGAVDDFDWIAKDGTNNRAAIQAALDTGHNVILPRTKTGMYQVNGGQLLINKCQKLSGDGMGTSYGPKLDQKHVTQTDIVFTGTGQSYAMTRRQARKNQYDPDDSALSVGVNVQHEGAIIEDLCIRLWVDYTNNSPSNYGDHFDVGLFLGCARQSVNNVRVFGYFRQAAIYIDGTKSSSLARFSTPEGVQHAAVTFSGTDQVTLSGVTTKGGKKGLFVAGAKNSANYKYYDALSNADHADEDEVVHDNEGGRGDAGMSDLCTYNCTFFGPDHHSGQRLVDPRPDMNFDLEDIDNLAGSLFIDGRRKSGLLGGRVRRMSFFNTRLRTFEAVRCGLGQASELYFYSLHTETGASSAKSAAGDPIAPSDSSINYGSIAVTTPTDSESIGSIGTTGVYIHGINSSILTDHFMSKFERWSVFSTGGGSTGGRNYVNDIRVGQDAVRITPNNTTFDQSGNFLVKNDDINSLIATSSYVTSYKVVRPDTDNTLSLGLESKRWSDAFIANGVTSTSDEREKEQSRILIDAERLAAQELKSRIRAFKWTESVQRKGSEARWHFGIMAQDIMRVFEAHGLDAHNYGLFCYDRWDEEQEQCDGDGNILCDGAESGDRYGVRYDQLMAFIISAL